ncbi:hypothetical protein [Gimesia sp.]|uniref:hypothetical protein n=1 Tax=Gimesia sp. TaxID=2024833 RepID=UPI000C4B66AF|nr:hypothetical protein [Gimesia sp.]MAX36659.1 hypothetical protein [Gimesia sp.]HAH44195.1 hypothetical protein [Planctomycetaceae bacterium]HBL45464.1 hypothetical protein [Planctomycetaceae bacterium]|tara:strand:- start:1063 stop:1266 length:204 start_codon:yes stop_codon:yes gene_type:complete
MRVLFLISRKNAPFSRFRVLNYLPCLRKAGVECTVKDYSQPPSDKPVIGWTGLDTNIPNLKLVVSVL